jgi:uncharacterized membrane protein
MENNTPKSKTGPVIIVNVAICLLAFLALVKSIENGETWRIVCASLGFLIFSTFTFLVIRKYRTQHK